MCCARSHGDPILFAVSRYQITKLFGNCIDLRHSFASVDLRRFYLRIRPLKWTIFQRFQSADETTINLGSELLRNGFVCFAMVAERSVIIMIIIIIRVCLTVCFKKTIRRYSCRRRKEFRWKKKATEAIPIMSVMTSINALRYIRPVW